MLICCFTVSMRESSVGRLWFKVTTLMTFLIPDSAIPGFEPLKKRAWREKVALCGVFGMLSTVLLTYLIWVPSTLCPVFQVMSLDEIKKQPPYRPHVIIHGKVYDFSEFASKHVKGQAIPHHIFEYAGKDASHLFPLFGTSDEVNQLRFKQLQSLDTEDLTFKPHFHSMQDLMVAYHWPKSFDVCYDWTQIGSATTSDNAWIVIDSKVYDVSRFKSDISALERVPAEIKSVLDDPNFSKLIDAPWGRDKSKFARYPQAQEHLKLLDGYAKGVLDYRKSPQCKASNAIMVGSTALMVLIILVKFFASLQLGVKAEPEKLRKNVIILIPCYSEDQTNLRATIDSVCNMNYDSRRKVIFIVCDGLVKGEGNSATTPELLLDILGFEETIQSFVYESISSEGSDLNRAKLYFGHYRTSSDESPVAVVLIVKTGLANETSKPGNRGKRDSQLIVMRFLSKLHQRSPMSPLELELCRGCYQDLKIDLRSFEFLMMIDADTEVFTDSLNRLLAACVHDSKIIGICGETRIKNEKETWVTMIQVYEYFISHHMSKAFESLFGCVTCLPGCFCMYRLKDEGKENVLLLKPALIDEYSECNLETLHQRNLLSLGEDRYLTTLVLKHFPRYRTKFCADAVCKTIVPETWSVLLSQRRRWINSTVHNLFELLLLPNLCGFCMFSMRFVIIMDLFSTIILPATVIYMIYLGYVAIKQRMSAEMSLLMLASIYGLQSVVFILKKQWQHIGWMFIYLFAIPIFGFFIPVYSFWHFDDFTWGRTREVADEMVKDPELGEDYRSNALVLRTWDEFAEEFITSVPTQAIQNITMQQFKL